VKYERPGIEQRVEVTGPVIAGAVPAVSGPVTTPRWAPHDAPDGAGGEGS
jgi:hypothetical protein